MLSSLAATLTDVTVNTKLIHEHVDSLQWALDLFCTKGVEQVVVIGDVFEMGERIEQTCDMLSQAKAVGVWGNHDFGLCFQPDDEIRARYSATVLLLPRINPSTPTAGC